jgi:transposase
LHIAHNPSGIGQLLQALEQVVGSGSKEQMGCVIETKQNLLITALLAAGWPVYPVNPKSVDRWRSPAGAKSDQLDAYYLAKIGRSDWSQLVRLQPDSELISELKQLTRDQQRLLSQHTRLINQLKACLKAYYPAALHCFPKLAQKSTLAFLRAYPTPEQAAQATEQELVQVLKQAGHTTATRVAPRVRHQLQQPALRADAATSRAKARLLLALVPQLQVVLEQMAAYEQAIEELWQQHPDHEQFASLPGAGERLAPRLLAELGDDPASFEDPQRWQRLAGSVPVLKQSGKQRSVSQRLACVKPLRDVLYLFALQTIKHEPWCKQYYRQKRKEGKSHAQALRALASIWLRIICAMRRSGTYYQREVFVASQHRHQCPAA